MIKAAATTANTNLDLPTHAIISEMPALNPAKFRILKFDDTGQLFVQGKSDPFFDNFEIAFEGQGFYKWVILKKDGKELFRSKFKIHNS